MKAILLEKYGIPEDVLEIKEVEKPSPKEFEVLVKVYASAINDYDWSMVRGKPYLYRLMFGLFKPKNQIPGMEVAGVIEALGANVQGFNVGDAVFGDTSAYGFGTLAEYVCINEKALVKKPVELSFNEAASIPHAFALASQGLNDLGKISQGQKVLINGGGSGVGILGLQIAKMYDCEVTGVDAYEKLGMMKSLGFDFVIDYKRMDFTKNGEEYDLVLDCKTNKPAFSYLRSLKTNAKYVSIGGNLTSLIKLLIIGKMVSLFSAKKLLILSLKANKDMDYFISLFKQNKIKCKIDGPYLLDEVPRLIQYFGDGDHQGKIVIKMCD